MAQVFFIHWNETEAKRYSAAIEAGGHRVLCHWSAGERAAWPEGYRPDAVVISLERLPSHGRAYAEWLWEARKRQTIPLIFTGGAEDKVAATRSKFPRACFCAMEQLSAKLADALAASQDVPTPAARVRGA